MAGRPRRASTSSVDTEDESQISWKQEKSVLRFTPGGVDPDTLFELKDAVVLNKDGHTMENALDVATRGPYIIRGKILIEDQDQKSHFIMKIRSLSPLEVRKCGQYSIGESDTGSPIIWVEGACAWFELTPSLAYLPIYRKMQEAVRLYYRMMAVCRGRQPKKAKKSKKDILKELHHVFHEYAASIGDGSTLEEVVARCDEHASFLIAQCTQDQSEVEWPATPFYKWLIDRHQDLYNKERERLENPPRPQRSPSVEVNNPPASQMLPSRTRNGSSAPSTTRSNATSETVEIEGNPPRQRYSRSRSATSRLDNNVIDLASSTQVSRDASIIPTPASVRSSASASFVAPPLREVSVPVNSEDKTPFQSVLNALEWVCKEVSNSKGGRMSLSAVTNKLWMNFKFPNYTGSIKPSYRVPIQEVLHYNASALLEILDKDKYGGEFYSWLQDIAGQPFNIIAMKKSDFPFKVVRRKQSTNTNSNKLAPTVQAGATTKDLSDGFSSPARSSPAGKSLRRPGRPSGIKSSLRLATASKKRPHSEVDSDSEDEESGPKRSHYFSDEDESLGNDGQLSSSEGEGGVTHGNPEEPIKIFLRADNIPTTIPRGPCETWVCEEEDCGYVVRGGDVEDCRDRIRCHFNEHEQQMDRVNLAMTEGSRGHLPVKYAYFPPFLILVEMHPPTIASRNPTPVDEFATVASTPTLANSPLPLPRLPLSPNSSPVKTPGPTARRNFRTMVDEFRRRPHPVSDNIDRLTFSS
ncbi:hypothetical protein F53441_4344 [Fusarium austroafricanum]|uniref:RFTS domain-containing protein n=1 Tax=Fusarium austroafricanum TaxID=2364996 RepID=A0A8H4KNI4_9HYPO|nr:hypothetical protein F53441_4344 [Fusarium austroafricanum]